MGPANWNSSALLRASVLMATLAACGGGGGGGIDGGAGAGDGGSSNVPAFDAIRESASMDPACLKLGDFYWSVGDATGVLVSGSIGTKYDASTRMAIFSASKWIFSSYVLESQAGVLTESLIKGLNFTSGYVEEGLPLCSPTDTVGTCFDQLDNYVAAKDNSFFYASGHMQKIAANDLGLADLDEAGFATEIMRVLGTELDLNFDVNVLGGVQAGPLAAGGMNTSPQAYEGFLTRMLAGQYEISSRLGDESVSTGLATIDYALGHWVEKTSSGAIDAYSSVGALGVYPWIDGNKEYWGLLARVGEASPMTAADDSLVCGRQMRAAFLGAR
jgi:hypothetical protein